MLMKNLVNVVRGYWKLENSSNEENKWNEQSKIIIIKRKIPKLVVRNQSKRKESDKNSGRESTL